MNPIVPHQPGRGSKSRQIKINKIKRLAVWLALVKFSLVVDMAKQLIILR